MSHPDHPYAGTWNDHDGPPAAEPFNGVVEIGPDPPVLSLVTDSSWQVITPDGNREGKPITGVGLTFETFNPGWNSDLQFDTSSWEPASEDQVWDAGIWGPNEQTPTYFRKIFSVPPLLSQAVLLGHVEDDALIYINGNLVFSDTSGGVEAFAVGPLDVTSYLIPGENLIAVKAHDSWGGLQVLELGLFGTVIPEPTSLLLLLTGLLPLLYWYRKK